MFLSYEEENIEAKESSIREFDTLIKVIAHKKLMN